MNCEDFSETTFSIGHARGFPTYSVGLFLSSPLNSHHGVTIVRYVTFTIILLLFSLLVSLNSSLAEPWMGHLIIQDNQVWQGGRLGNYGTVHYFLDEEKNEQIPLDIFVEVYGDNNPPEALHVEVVTNLNRRDRAKVWESSTEIGRPDSYYMTYPMSQVGHSGNNERYKVSLKATRTGAYRLTARFKDGNGKWWWHNDFLYDKIQQRDCAIVVSPAKGLNLTMYEANPLVVEASTGGGAKHRSTM